MRERVREGRVGHVINFESNVSTAVRTAVPLACLFPCCWNGEGLGAFGFVDLVQQWQQSKHREEAGVCC